MKTDPFRAYRELERWLFQGVSELPESIWDDDPNTHVADRGIGKPHVSSGLPLDFDEGAAVAFAIVFDPESKAIEYVRVSEEGSLCAAAVEG